LGGTAPFNGTSGSFRVRHQHDDPDGQADRPWWEWPHITDREIFVLCALFSAFLIVNMAYRLSESMRQLPV
jgi:hypothetical protein